MTKKIIGICALLIIALGSGIYLAAIHSFEKNESVALTNPSTASLAQSAEQLPGKKPPSLILPNATKAFAAGLAQDIIKKNPNGPTTGNAGAFINALDPDAAVNAVISDAVKNIGYDTFAEPVPLSELTLIQDTALPVLETYFSALSALLTGTHKKMSSLTGTLSPKQFITAGILIDSLITNLKALPTPARVADLHRKQIELLLVERNIFEAIGNAESDPVLGIAALQLFPIAVANINLVNEEFIALKKILGIN